jgi:hypothetical protein
MNDYQMSEYQLNDRDETPLKRPQQIVAKVATEAA